MSDDNSMQSTTQNTTQNAEIRETEREKEVNSMYINSEKNKRGECYTTEKVWRGCVRREIKK